MSLHADALALLGAWDPPTPTQGRLRDRYVAHLREHPDGLSRTCRPDHLTASTVVLSADRTRVLLTLHAKAGRWFQLGGHCEAGDPTLAAAAQREAREESGVPDLVVAPWPVHLDEHVVPFCGGPDASSAPVHHLDVRFLAVAAEDVAHAVSEESLDLRWWPVDELPDPALDELVTAALAAGAGAPAAQSSSPGGTSTRAAADQPSR